jgi:signal transduction histidine kinase
MDQPLSGKQFHRRLRNLILVTWTIPPIFGLSFLMYIDMFTPSQMQDIISSPIEPVFILGWIVLAAWYLPRMLRPVNEFLDKPETVDEARVTRLLRIFPLYYWSAFIIYLILAPTSVMFSAIDFSDYVATPIDWFRIHLVSLIVSIIVGLPIFFTILDLFGLVAGRLHLHKPHVTLKTKVFMIGALLPLLIDTMLVQYYWTRTGFFSEETFFVWLTLEFLAICGSLIFVRSIGQSLSPLQELINSDTQMTPTRISALAAKSTDELGVITTDYHQLLEELYAHRHELENQVQLRTQELISINNELESFAYSVSHDLRAPLRSINGFAHILFDNYARDLDEEGREYLQRIVDASTRMSQIIDALLNLSRVTRSSLHRESVNISNLAGNILECQHRDKSERLVETRILPDLTVNADKILTQVMLENLLSNALKFTAYQKHTVIEIGQVRRDDETYFYIADNGAGFDMRFSDKLFQAFQRLHPQYDFEGVGIGLATVQRIIDIHGGKIWAESKPGEGATFYFTL